MNKFRFGLDPFLVNFFEVGFSQNPLFFAAFRIRDAEMESEKNAFTFTGIAVRFLHGFHNPSQ